MKSKNLNSFQTSRTDGLVFYYKTDNFFMSVEVVETELSLNVGFGTSQQLISLEDSFFICECRQLHSSSAYKCSFK